MTRASGRGWLAVGAALAGLGVIAGAFGAHGLEGKLSADRFETFEVAVRYQMYHALALLLLGLLMQRPSRGLTAAGWFFLAGMALFSGCLYAWIFTEVRTFALIVPLGGTFFILGWLTLTITMLRQNAPTSG